MENNENIPEYRPSEAPQTQNFQPSTPVWPQEPVNYEHNSIPAEQPAPPRKKGKRITLQVIAAFVLALVLVVVSSVITAFYSNKYWVNQNDLLSLKVATLSQKVENLQTFVNSNSYTGNGNSVSGTTNGDPAKVYAQNKASVVAISNQGITTNIFGQVAETASSGSGFIISADGYIVTNYHVIEDAKTLTVITIDQQEYDATVVGFDESNDFALLKINATDLPDVKLGSSANLIEGDQVAAIGNPLGELTNTLTVGVISAKDRDVETGNSVINMLQTDSAINPGNSGGPLFNMNGEVVGITTAKVAGDDIEGLNFAIPIDDVKDLITQLMEKGYISTPYMGITINNKRNGFGVLIESVESNSPADTAGLRVGDIIVGIGEYETTTLAEMDKVLRKYEPGNTVAVFVYRNRMVMELSLTFGEKEQTPETP
ncbi:MAG: trypsin-like serine protease [Ruminococcaceae bacterium]|nr:trypsin-like serine protease [Oscillospiraceae bacterium]